MNFTIVIPYFNGEKTIRKLIETVGDFDILLVNDKSDSLPDFSAYKNVHVVNLVEKGYFTGAVNKGIELAKGDVLVLNQDVYFTNDKWLTQLSDGLKQGFSYIGERIKGERKDWPFGYIHGTFMYITRELINSIGLLNADRYPMWGSTAEYQLKAARAGFKILPLDTVQGFVHVRGNKQFGESFKKLLIQENNNEIYLKTPPLVSVVIPVHGEKYARFLPSTVNSLVGGKTDLGLWKQQTFASFEVVIVDDSSYDNTPQIVKSVCDSWRGVRSIRLDRPKNEVISETNGKYIGKVVAMNTGINDAFGKYISILDADDMMEPDRLEMMVKAIEANPHSIIYDDVQRFSDGERLDKWPMEEYNFERLIAKNIIHNALMFEKSAWEEIGGYPARFIYGREDWAINVRFGIHGYCGVHLKNYFGLLHRRADHNRTIENTKGDWMGYFAKKMREQYPDLYKGVRTMACCGRKTSNSSLLQRTDAYDRSRATTLSAEGTTLVIYNGNRVGHFPVYGFFTSRMYRVNPGIPMAVDNRDLYSGDPRRNPGILDRYEGDHFMFSLYLLDVDNVDIKEEEIQVAQIMSESETMLSMEPEPEVTVDFTVLDGSIYVLEQALKNNQYTKAQLEMLYGYELENKNRTGAKDALENAIRLLS